MKSIFVPLAGTAIMLALVLMVLISRANERRARAKQFSKTISHVKIIKDKS